LDHAFAAVQREVLDWISRKAGRQLPADAWEGHTFELDEVGAQHVATAALDTPRYWAARADDADRYVAQRTWITEIGLAVAPAGGVMFGCRLLVSARGENPPYQPSIPGFVRDAILGGEAFLDGRGISQDLWTVRSKSDVDELYSLMIAKGRRTNICLFSLAEDKDDVTTTAASAIAVHKRTLGAAHVAVLTGSAAFMLTDIVGKEFSVFNRAVRTYRPGFETDADDPLRHPIAFAHRIATWQDSGIEGPDAFENFLVRNCILQTVAGDDLESVLPPFSEVRRVASTISINRAQDSGASKDQLLRLFEGDNAKLRADLDEERAIHDSLLQDAERERDEAQRRADEARSATYSLNQRIRSLEAQHRARGDANVVTDIPSDLSGIKAWADENIAGSVILTNRALRGAKESDYEDPALVYNALLLLRDHYVPMRREGGEELAKSYHDSLLHLGLEDSLSITSTRLGEQGDEYLVQHNGRKRELERHLKKGSSRESRHCFRLYYFWDEEDQQVVVGWLTSHLGTRET
jgi:hypothetical protein